MSNSFVYGQTINYSFTLHNNGESVSLPASGLVSSRLYGPTTRPTNNQRDRTDTSGFVEEVTSWSGGTQENEKIIVFSGITDATPHSTEDADTFFVVTNFYIQDDDQKEVIAEEVIHVLRPDAWSSRVTVAASDLTQVQNKLTDFFSTTQINNHIESGKTEVIRHLENKGMRKDRIYDLEKLNDAVKYASLASACFDLASEEETVWLTKFEKYTEKWKDIADNQLIPFDQDNDDVPEYQESTDVAPKTGIIIMER